MKKHLLILALLALAMQGCGIEDSDCAIALWGSCNNEHNPADDYEQRTVRWGLRLQIGDYVIDSIFPPPIKDGSIEITMDKISEKVPNYKEARYIGRVNNWDPECAETITLGGGSSSKSIYTNVDPLGYFNFSEIFDIHPGGGTFDFMPDFGFGDSARRLRCNYSTGIKSIRVHFEL